jgi:TIR domain
VSYSHQDEEIRNELIKHLSPLRRLNLIADWHDRKIEAGDKWEQVISENLKKADIVIVIISIDFINSAYCYDVEMEMALDRAAAGQATIIPVIARRCIWKNSPFSSYQTLPTDGKAIATWPDRDEALSVVAEGVQQVAERIMSSR